MAYGVGSEPERVALATEGFGTQRQRSERGPTKSPRAFAIGLILYGNYTFPSPAPRIQPALCRFNCWLCGVGSEPERVALATEGFGTQRQRSERGPTKSPRAFAIGLILYGNYTFPSPAPEI